MSRVDAFAMHHHPSKNNRRRAYEVKISRADFLRDIRQPLKHRAALNVSIKKVAESMPKSIPRLSAFMPMRPLVPKPDFRARDEDLKPIMNPSKKEEGEE